MKYRGRLFALNGELYSWQLMFDSKGPLCCRYLLSGCSGEEKRVRVPKPDMSLVEMGALDTLFETFHLCNKDQEAIINICLNKRWNEDAKKMCERLAKADWEKYGRRESR